MNADFEAALSRERFSRYLAWADGDRRRAFELYALNTKLSEALYTPLQTLEVTLRNRIHAVLMEERGERWFDGDFLRVETQRRQLKKTYEDLELNGKPHERKGEIPDSGRVVAALNFGFWTSMLKSKYDDLWTDALHRIARSEDGGNLARGKLFTPLHDIRRLRNRIAHHEPILHWNLPKHHGNILLLTRWLSPAAAEWCKQNSRFQEVHPAERIILYEDSRS